MMDNIIIIPNEYKDEGLKHTREIVKIVLLNSKKVILPGKYKEYFCDIDGVTFKAESELFEEGDLALVAGGDGSIIHTARKAALVGIPIIGINLGRLGYLAELELEDIHMLSDVFEGKFKLEKRMMLSYEIYKNDSRILVGKPALNDIVLTSVGNTNRVVDIELHVGKEEAFAGLFKGNGIIASTPTGSTAYALAAGGPIVDPLLECINIVPLCTHSLTARPMIFGAESELKLVNAGRVDINVSADGSDEYTIEPGEYVVVKKSVYAPELVRINQSSFYEVLKHKMADK